MTPTHVRNVLSMMARCLKSKELPPGNRLTVILQQHDDMIDFARAALVQADRSAGPTLADARGTEAEPTSSPATLLCRGAHLEGGS